MNKPTLAVLIPAFNEAHNIQHIIGDVLWQRSDAFELQEILVISDGSSDNTVANARSIDSPLVRVVDDGKRLGKIARLNQAFEAFDSDIVVQLDADVRIANEYVLEHLIRPFATDTKIGIVCGNHLPLEPKTFVERIGFLGTMAWSKALDMNKKESTMFRCSGHIRAFSKTMYTNFRTPLRSGSSEDTRSFYYAVAHGHAVVFVSNALVYFRLPTTVSDYLKQMRRFLGERELLVEDFGEDLVKKYETLDFFTKVRAVIQQLLQTPPHVACGYISLQLLAHIGSKPRPKTGIWEVSESTKRV